MGSPLDSMLGQAVTLKGRAGNAMLGAVVVLEDRTPLYVEGLAEWDDAANGRSVSASGVLRRKRLAPEAEWDSQGGRSHGVEGTNWVLEGATWKLESP
jgi:hypothetical protein